MSDWSRSQFRMWLRSRVLDSSLPKVLCVAIHENRIEDVAERLGIHPSLAREVGEEYARRVVAAGRPLPTGPKTSEHPYPQLDIRVPAQVEKAWCELADRLHMTRTAAIRTLLHEYLKSDSDPVSDGRWMVAGHLVSGKIARSFKVAVTQGARSALGVRAERLGIPPTRLMRTLMVEAMAGRRRIGPPVSREAMFEDPTRYRIG